MNILVNKCVFSVHPVYDLYASDENGNIIHIIKKVPHNGSKVIVEVICYVVLRNLVADIKYI